jgi:two-component system, LuxR family, sensor histidine kinase TtrS
MIPVEGRAWTAPQDYTSVHALFRQLRIGPYEYLGHSTLMGFVWANWHWFLAAGLGCVWWIIHVARVETLVRRRTTELTLEIQEREKAEQTARLHREERDQFSRLGILGEMASNIAHELNQPLAAITNYAEGMTRLIDAGRTDPTMLRDGARGIAGQAERAGVIIRRIRAFVRRREVRRESLDISEVVRETLCLFEGPAKRSGVIFHLHLVPGLPSLIADRIEIEQVLLNLLQNALDAMTDLDARERGISVSTTRSDDTVEIAVRDHGTGLAPKIEAHLFETFFTTKPQGLGLGLSICRTIVESHGGRMWATNEATGGLTMRFALPLSPEDSR